MTVGRTGFEPVKVKPADLQSALVGRLSISPLFGNGCKGIAFFLYCKFLVNFFKKKLYFIDIYFSIRVR